MLQVTQVLICALLILGNTLARPMDPQQAPETVENKMTFKDKFSKVWQKIQPKSEPVVLTSAVKQGFVERLAAYKTEKQKLADLQKDYNTAQKTFQDHFIEVDNLKTRRAKLAEVLGEPVNQEERAAITKIDESIASTRQKANTELKQAVNDAWLALDNQRKVVQPLENDLHDFAKAHKAQLKQELLRPEHAFKETTSTRVKKPSQPSFGRTLEAKVHRIGQSFVRPF